ncbi:MAG: ion transporter [Verrucomicrobia bacterium]|nr:ion transporter [Verrucomicrobiota bacterium]MCH8528218.1 ion transporter [Kiritimatiellia bacterium]
MNAASPAPNSARTRTHEIIFGSDTRAGKAFDLVLILSILISTLLNALDTVESLNLSYGPYFRTLEWVFTVLFFIEYALRVWSCPKRGAYVFSFFGLVDLIGWLPSLIGLLLPGPAFLITLRTVRIIRVLRIFRILKMMAYIQEAEVLARALRAGSRKIAVFLFAVVTLVILLGSLMYLIEGPENGFTSIPVSVYWAVVTLTTVGYGDISPQTPPGQFLASAIMILGYAIIAVPTGIVSAEFIRDDQNN